MAALVAALPRIIIDLLLVALIYGTSHRSSSIGTSSRVATDYHWLTKSLIYYVDDLCKNGMQELLTRMVTFWGI